MNNELKTKEQLQKELDELLIDMHLYESAGSMLKSEDVTTVITMSNNYSCLTIQPKNVERLKEVLTSNNWRHSMQVGDLKKAIEAYDLPAENTLVAPVPAYAPAPIDLDDLPI